MFDVSGFRFQETVDILWQLLHSSLDGKPAPLPIGSRDYDKWKKIIDLAQYNCVGALCSHAVSLLDPLQRPPRSLWLPWIAQQHIVAQRSQHHHRVAHELTDIMHQHGIDTLILKGPKIAAYYPHPELREYNDLDVYHGRWSHEADQVVAKHLGLHIDTSDPHHSTYTFHGIAIENHHTFAHNQNAPSNKDYEALLLHHIPSATFEALYMLRHTASHFAASHATVKSIYDWAAFVRTRGSDVDWRAVGDAVRQSGMEPFVAAIQQLVAERLDVDITIPINSIDSTRMHRIEYEMTYGEFRQPTHVRSGWSRAYWKWSRYRANKWKRRIVYSDSEAIMLLRGIARHIRQPFNITHKH